MAITPMKIKDLTIGTTPATAYTFPSTDGAATQVLTTDGAGTITFAAAGGGGLPAGTLTGVMLYWNGAAWVEATDGLGRSIVNNFNGAGTGETFLTISAANNKRSNLRMDTDGASGTSTIEFYDTSSGTTYNYIKSSHLATDGIMLRHDTGVYPFVPTRFIVGDGCCIGVGWSGTTSAGASQHIKNWNFTGGQNVNGVLNLNTATYGSTIATALITVAATTVTSADAIYKNFGSAAASPSAAGVSSQRSDYVVHVSYRNNTTGASERVTYTLFAPDGVNIYTTESSFLQDHAGLRQLEMVSRYNGGQLQIGCWMNNVAVGDACLTNFTIIATG